MGSLQREQHACYCDVSLTPILSSINQQSKNSLRWNQLQDGIQYDKDAEGQEGGESTPQKKKSGVSAGKIEEYIAKVSSYKAGGDGGKCLKILKIYVSNVVDNPGEEKFKTINMENKAYKAKVKPFLGAKSLLMAVGFSPNDGGDALVLKDDADPQVLADTKAKLEAALAAY